MPIRRVSDRGGNIIGRFPSLKLERMVSFESLIERDFIYWLDFDLEVTWFMEQPLTICYQDGKKRLGYTPDFHVIENGRNILVECKPQQFITTDENRRKFAAARAWCARQGWTFQVVTDVQLGRSYRTPNIKLLTQFARYPVEPTIKHGIHACLTRVPAPVTVAEVMVNAAPDRPRRAFIPILAMAFHHELRIPLDESPISANSPVELGPGLKAGGGS